MGTARELSARGVTIRQSLTAAPPVFPLTRFATRKMTAVTGRMSQRTNVASTSVLWGMADVLRSALILLPASTVNANRASNLSEITPVKVRVNTTRKKEKT